MRLFASPPPPRSYSTLTGRFQLDPLPHPVDFLSLPAGCEGKEGKKRESTQPRLWLGLQVGTVLATAIVFEMCPWLSRDPSSEPNKPHLHILVPVGLDFHHPASQNSTHNV